MDYTITQSQARTAPTYVDALSNFLKVWSDSYLMWDIGPHLSCREAEALADLLAAYGQHRAVNCLRSGHVASDDEGDMNHNTAQPFTDEELASMASEEPRSVARVP